MQIIYGASEISVDNVDNLKTVGDIYEKFKDLLDLADDVSVRVNDTEADFNTEVSSDDVIEFIKPSGQKA